MKNKNGSLLIITGLLLVAAAFALIVYNLREANMAAELSRQVLSELPAEMRCELSDTAAAVQTMEKAAEPETVSGSGTVSEAETGPEAKSNAETGAEWVVPDYVLNPNMDMPTAEVDSRKYIGVLKIPSLGLELPVMSEWSYPNLKIAPCRYTGSAYLGNMVISAHNYVRHFGRLKELSGGEVVLFADADGNVFRYEVAELETLRPTAIEEMTAGEWDLTLFTCTIGGQSRVTVRCVLMKETEA